jgi:hypothetical protein
VKDEPEDDRREVISRGAEGAKAATQALFELEAREEQMEQE